MEEFRAYVADHHGVVSRGQARSLGLTEGQIKRRLRTGEFTRMAPSVYRLATAPSTWEVQARAGALAVRGLVRATGALAVWRVDGHQRRGDISILTRNNRRPRLVGVVVHRSSDADAIDGWLVDGIPVTSVTRSVLDSAASLSAADLDATMDAVIRQGLTTVDELQVALADLGTQGRKGFGELRRLLDARTPSTAVPGSRFNRLVGRLLVSAGLPEPTYEFEVRDGGRFIGRTDLAYPEAGLLIECDGARDDCARRPGDPSPIFGRFGVIVTRNRPNIRRVDGRIPSKR